MKNWSDLTAQYTLSKTLRFEIVPSKITRENLEKQNILVNDRAKQVAYKELKPLFDEFLKKKNSSMNLRDFSHIL